MHARGYARYELKKKGVAKTKDIDATDWSDIVRQLAKQAKRQSKVFYRRVKHTLLTPLSPSTLPTPTRKIQRILQRNNPWSARALDWIPDSPGLHDPEPPSVDELRALARAPRRKSPGPDGVPPYLLASLPDHVFSVVHQCICLCYLEGTLPTIWLTSETFCLFKGKGQWQDPDRWRPIAMSNSIYRLIMRWVYKSLYPLLSPHIHSKQFGGRQGVSTAHATHTFLDDLDAIGSMESILAFDVYHAFDSPPKYLIFHVLDRMGTPLQLLRLISLVLELGATFIRGAEHEVFRTTHGVKQGCPMSCFLFVIVFEIPLRFMEHHGLRFSAFVDDISSPSPPMHSQRNATLVQEALSLIGCQINVIKSEALPMVKPPPPAPTLPKYLHPVCAVQASTSIWSTRDADAPPWADVSERPFRGVSYLLHLGHPLSASLRLSPAVRIVEDELRSQLNELHVHPIQALDRVHVVNTLVIPRLLYRTECLPLSATELHRLTSLLERFVLGVMGLPTLIATKTLYTHRSKGMGMGYIPVLHPTRLLDSLHRNPYLQEFSVHPRLPITPFMLFQSALALLGPAPTFTLPPVTVTWDAHRLQREAVSVMSVCGLVVYLLPTALRPDSTYTDGSKMGSPPSSGAAAIMPNGLVAVCRVPGVPNSYKAELVGLLLGSHFSAEGDRLKLDCQGATASTRSQRRPICQAYWVQAVREGTTAKSQSPEWVEGHCGHEFNEAADKYAKIGTALPSSPPARPKTPWDVVRHGELVLPPHKVWSHDLAPHHTYAGFHPLSWRPLRFRRLAWYKWLFGLQSRLGYAHYATFWSGKLPTHACAHRGRQHNLSVQGMLAHCAEDHPLVSKWIAAWPPHANASIWRRLAQKADLRIAGRLAVPVTLYRFLAARLGGVTAARKAISRFQDSVLDLVTAVLESSVSPTSKRPNAFSPRDWDAPATIV